MLILLVISGFVIYNNLINKEQLKHQNLKKSQIDKNTDNDEKIVKENENEINNYDWISTTSINAEPWGIRAYIVQKQFYEEGRGKIAIEIVNIVDQKNQKIEDFWLVNDIENAKYLVGAYDCGGLKKVIALTNEGNIYISENIGKQGNPNESNYNKFDKKNLDEKIIKIGTKKIGYPQNPEISCSYDKIYLLTEQNKVIEI